MERDNWHVYILRCSDGSLYTGISTDVHRRLNEYNQSLKGAKYTKSRRPVNLVFSYFVGSRSAASKIEYGIKKLSKKNKEKIIENPHLLLQLLPQKSVSLLKP